MQVKERILEDILSEMEESEKQFKQLEISEEPSEKGKKMIAEIQELLGIDKSLSFDETLQAIDKHQDNEKVKQILTRIIKSF